MPATTVPPMGLASAYGGILTDIRVEKRLATGRGKKLTLAQENVLRRLYELELPSIPHGEIPVKRFWVHLAARFHQCCGREYSWLSVKRKIMGSVADSQQPIPNSCVEQASNEEPTVEIAPLNVASGSTPPGLDSADESRSPLGQRQTPSNSHCADSPGLNERDGSPAVVGDWTRRVLFPHAAKRTKQTRNTAKMPHPPRANHRPLSTSDRGGLSGPAIPPSSSRTLGDRRVSKPVSRKRKRLAADCDSSSKMSRGDTNTPRKPHEAVTEDLDSLYPSDPDDLPNTPTHISRKLC